MNEAATTFSAGLTFRDYADSMRVHREAFLAHYERLGFIVDELRDAQLFASIRILAITEDWCVDNVLNLPLLARFAEASAPGSLRIVRRPDCRALADTYPGRGGVSRVPTAVFLDEADRARGHWSERCASSQRWLDGFTEDHPMPDLDISDGIPAPPLMNWMKLRIHLEQDRFVAGAWRDVLGEIRAILGEGSLIPTAKG